MHIISRPCPSILVFSPILTVTLRVLAVSPVDQSTKAAIDRWREGGLASLQSGGEERAGNGSLMRLAPLALMMAGAEPREMREACVSSSRVTHRHPAARVWASTPCLPGLDYTALLTSRSPSPSPSP